MAMTCKCGHPKSMHDTVGSCRAYLDFYFCKCIKYYEIDMDPTDNNKIKKILEDQGCTNIKFNQFVLVNRDSKKRVTLLVDVVRRDMIEQWKVISHPDVSCWFEGQRLLIKIDGKYPRNYDKDFRYEDYQINCIKLNKEYLDKMGMTWKGFITSHLVRFS